eukprot:80558-Pyramimonas_sp.AAC.1
MQQPHYSPPHPHIPTHPRTSTSTGCGTRQYQEGLSTDQSDTGSVGIFACRTNQTQDVRGVSGGAWQGGSPSHTMPVRRVAALKVLVEVFIVADVFSSVDTCVA